MIGRSVPPPPTGSRMSSSKHRASTRRRLRAARVSRSRPPLPRRRSCARISSCSTPSGRCRSPRSCGLAGSRRRGARGSRSSRSSTRRGAGPARLGALPRLCRALRRPRRARSRSASTAAPAPRTLDVELAATAALRSGRDVRDREQPPRGAPPAGLDLTRPSWRRRSAPSTCARSRTSSSSISRPQTYVKGFLRTYADYPRPRRAALRRRVQLALRRRRRARPTAAPLVRAAAAPEPAHRDARSCCSRSPAIAVVTARHRRRWKFGGGSPADAEAADREAAARPRPPAPRSCRSRGKGSSYVAVHRGSAAGAAALPGHDRARRARSRSTGKCFWLNVSSPENLRIIVGGKARRRSPAGRSRVTLTVTPERGAAAEPAARGHRRHGVASSCAATATTSTGRSSRESLLRLGIEPAELRDRRRRRRTSSRRRCATALADDLRRHLGRARPDARRPHGRAARAGAGVGAPRSTRTSRREIEARSRAVAERLRRPYADFAAGRAQAGDDARGRDRRGPRRHRAGLLSSSSTACVAVTLPGPPRELQRARGRARSRRRRCGALLARAQPPERRVLRFFGVCESAVAQALADAGGDGDGVEVTICARDSEIHVDLFVAARRGGAGRRARGGVRRALARAVPLRDATSAAIEAARARALPRARA